MKRAWLFAVCGVIVFVLGLVGCDAAPAPYSGEPEPVATAPREDTPKADAFTEATPVEKIDSEQLSGVPESATEESGLGMMMVSEPTDYNTEEYDAVKESGYVSTRSNPLSTISADVDTASYANVRRMLRDGLKEIPTGAVRIEEMLNYFDYDYPAPTGEDPFSLTARMGRCPWNKDTELLVLGYGTGQADPSFAKKGSNLVFLIDVSGSMDDADKLPLLQSSFGQLVTSLGENDRVSIVTYSGEEEVVLKGTKGSDQTTIMRAVRGLKADGSTNGEAGLRMAYDVAQEQFIEGGVNRIIMASDGDLNVGMTSESDLHDFVDKQREKGIYLSVLGFGANNYKDNKMETLADHGNGSYHYIDCEAEAVRVFKDRLTTNVVPFADDVKVQVEFNPAHVKGYRLIGYENRAMEDEDFVDDAKDAGEVGPGSQFTVLYEVVRNDSPMEINTPELKYGQNASQEGESSEWLTAKLRYKPASGGDVRQQELAVAESDWAEDPGKDWRFAAAVAEFGMVLRDSEYKGTSSLEEARKLVDAGDDELRKEFLDLLGLAEKN